MDVMEEDEPQSEESDEELWLRANCASIQYPTPAIGPQTSQTIYVFSSAKHAKLVAYQTQQHLEQCAIWSRLTKASLAAAQEQQDASMVSVHRSELSVLSTMTSNLEYQSRVASNPWAYTIPGQDEGEIALTEMALAVPHFVSYAGVQTRYVSMPYDERSFLIFQESSTDEFVPASSFVPQECRYYESLVQKTPTTTALGLRSSVTLLPHQQVGVGWMREKERSSYKGGICGSLFLLQFECKQTSDTSHYCS